MKTLPSVRFPNCTFPPEQDAGFYDIVPDGFANAVSLYLGSDTVTDDAAIAKAGAFFDRLLEWDVFCRNTFASAEKGSEDYELIMEYFGFYQEEVPEVFGTGNVVGLSLEDMVKCLTLAHMGTHGSGAEQSFNVDFTLGYDQLLCVYFNSDSSFNHIAWES